MKYTLIILSVLSSALLTHTTHEQGQIDKNFESDDEIHKNGQPIINEDDEKHEINTPESTTYTVTDNTNVEPTPNLTTDITDDTNPTELSTLTSTTESGTSTPTETSGKSSTIGKTETTDESANSTESVNTDKTTSHQHPTEETTHSSSITDPPTPETPTISTSTISTTKFTFPPTSTTVTTESNTTEPPSHSEDAKVPGWAIAIIAILVCFALLFTFFYFLRKHLLRKRRADRQRLLGRSQEGFFMGGFHGSDANL